MATCINFVCVVILCTLWWVPQQAIDPTKPDVNFDASALTFSESVGTATVTLRATHFDINAGDQLDVNVMVSYDTATAADVNIGTPVTVQFTDMDTKSFTFTVVNDMIKEPDERFVLQVEVKGDSPYTSSNRNSLTITITDDDSSGTFDCRRQGQQICKNSATCSSNGVCECTAGWEGYKCDIETAQIDATQCVPPCVSGKCVNGAPPTCHCDADHVDEGICDKPRYKVQCDSTKMSINIVPIGTFSGIIYTNRYQSSCEFQKTSEQTGLPDDFTEGHARVIPHQDANCGNAVSKTEANDVRITRRIYVQYHADFASSIDEVVEGVCSYTTGQTVIFESTFRSVLPSSIGTGGEDGAGSVRISAGGKFNPLRLTVLKDGVQVTSNTPIRIGTVLTLELNVFPESDFEDFRIDTLTIDNNKEDTDKKLISVITNGCHAGGDTRGVIPEPTRSQGSLKMVFTLTTIKFSKSNELRIKFDAHLCVKTDTTGCVVQCGTRKRRESGSSKTETIQVVMKIWEDKVEESTGDLEVTQKPDGSAQAGDTSSLFGMTPVIFGGVITVGIIIIVFIIVVALFTWRMLRNKREKFQNF